VLALDPDNADVKKYIAILKKNLGGSKETSKAAGKAEAGAKTEM
jgi:hypothetical protein